MKRLLSGITALLVAEVISFAAIPYAVVPDEDKQVNVTELLDFANKYIGTRYRSAGKKPGGFDCSGFTSYVFGQFGLKLNSSSASQYTQGTKVEREEIRPGDLVFFTGRNASSKKVGHVGIITEVQDGGLTFKFIHAAVTKGVTIDRFPDDYYYYKRLIGFKRIDGLANPHEVLDLPILNYYDMLKEKKPFNARDGFSNFQTDLPNRRTMGNQHSGRNNTSDHSFISRITRLLGL